MDSAVDIDYRDGVAIDSPWGDIGRDLALCLVSLGSKVLLSLFNRTTVVHGEGLEQQVMDRPPGLGLLTVCNHTSTVDDPAVLSALLPWRTFCTESRHHCVRWSLCAMEICFRNKALGQFFLAGKVLPIDRGAGLEQPAMRTAAHLLARGDWVHLFPEGRVGYTGRLQPCKWGVGKLVCDSVQESGRDPVVLPFYHSGMAAVMPEHGRIPRVGKHVTITVGEPVDVSDLTCRCRHTGEQLRTAWRDITERVCEALHGLEEASPPNLNQRASKEQVRAAQQEHGEERLKKDDPVLPEH